MLPLLGRILRMGRDPRCPVQTRSSKIKNTERNRWDHCILDWSGMSPRKLLLHIYYKCWLLIAYCIMVQGIMVVETSVSPDCGAHGRSRHVARLVPQRVRYA